MFKVVLVSPIVSPLVSPLVSLIVSPIVSPIVSLSKRTSEFLISRLRFSDSICHVSSWGLGFRVKVSVRVRVRV